MQKRGEMSWQTIGTIVIMCALILWGIIFLSEKAGGINSIIEALFR